MLRGKYIRAARAMARHDDDAADRALGHSLSLSLCLTLTLADPRHVGTPLEMAGGSLAERSNAHQPAGTATGRGPARATRSPGPPAAGPTGGS